MSDDELELDTLGDRKTALFLIMSDTDTTFNFVIAMLQSQLFNLLCDKADDVYGGPSMCGASWTSSPISGRYPTSTS
jgi:type IV secretion system protein VirD4